MLPRTARLLDPANKLVAVMTVTEEGDHFGGTIDLASAPPAVRAVFDEYEEVVNGQMFSFLDEVQAKVAGLKLSAAFSEGFSGPVADLQVYPSTGEVSFKLAAVPAADRPR